MRTWRVAPIIPGMRSPYKDTPEDWEKVYKNSDFFVCDRDWTPMEIHRIIVGVNAGSFPIFPPSIPKQESLGRRPIQTVARELLPRALVADDVGDFVEELRSFLPDAPEEERVSHFASPGDQ